MAKGKFEKPRISVAKETVDRTQKKKNSKGLVLAIVSVICVLAIMAFVGVYIYGSKLEGSRTIFPNVRVAGIEVGGMTASEAQEIVEKSVQDAYVSQVLQVQLEDKLLVFAPQQTKVALNPETAIKKAVAFGKQNGPFQAIKTYFDSNGEGYDIELETALELDADYIRSIISRVAASDRINARNSQVTLGQDQQSITVTKGTPGRFLDEDALYDAVYDAFQKGNFELLNWEYVEIPYVEVELSQYFKEMSTEVKDAYYDEKNHKIVEGVSGFNFDLEAQTQKLKDAPYGSTLDITVEEILPEVTKEQLEKNMFSTQLDLRSSPYPTNNSNRTENLRLACAAIDGLIMNPGEVFSFNNTVGERSEAKGYKPATVFGGEGESVDGIGGGICQVASTIYWSTLYMDLETVMREPHMYTVNYVPEGMDATVYWDSGLDFKFKNNRKHPIMMKANTDGGYVNISFWGVKENDNYVEMSNKTIASFSEDDVEKVDDTKPIGYWEQVQWAYLGKKVEAYQKVFDGNGNLIKERTIYSTYKARPNIYVVGPTEEEKLPDPDLDLDLEQNENLIILFNN